MKINITPVMYYCWILYTCYSNLNILCYSILLFQQFVIDAWLYNDVKNIKFYYFNQETLYAEKYSTTYQAFTESVSPDKVGYYFIIFSIFKNSLYYM